MDNPERHVFNQYSSGLQVLSGKKVMRSRVSSKSGKRRIQAVLRTGRSNGIQWRMPNRTSAGLLMFRVRQDRLELLLVHPGGPFWKNKDDGSWSIPKGEAADGENLLEAAKREFQEETGTRPQGDFIALSPIKLKSGKVVHAWAIKGDLDPGAIMSNTFEMEWPPRSGKKVTFPEVDRAGFFDIQTALRKVNPAQMALLIELQTKWNQKN